MPRAFDDTMLRRFEYAVRRRSLRRLIRHALHNILTMPAPRVTLPLR